AKAQRESTVSTFIIFLCVFALEPMVQNACAGFGRGVNNAMHSSRRWLVQLLIVCALSLGFSFSAHCEDNVIHLLNGHDLSNFYSFTKQSGPNDTNHVFTLTNGILHVSGQE